MSRVVNDLLAQARCPNPEQQAEFARKLAAMWQGQADLEPGWGDAIARCVAELEAGNLPSLTADEALTDLSAYILSREKRAASPAPAPRR